MLHKIATMKKNQTGFTLIEIIVTAVIVAVLASVAIPIYFTYLESSRQEVVDNLAKTGAAAANSYKRRTNQAPTTKSQLNLFIPDTTRYTVTVGGASVTVKDTKYNKTSTVNY